MQPPAFDNTLTLFDYGFPVDRMIQALKFQGRMDLGSIFGRLMGDHIMVHSNGVPDCILPIPLHRRRLSERGYNQALEIARPLARSLGLPLITSACRRERYTRANSGLRADDRRRNIKGAFQVQAGWQRDHVAIVDDVMTTGHTAGELSRVLRRSGVRRISVWVFARAVPSPKY